MPKIYVPSLRYDKKVAPAYFKMKEKWLMACTFCKSYLGKSSPTTVEVVCTRCETINIISSQNLHD